MKYQGKELPPLPLGFSWELLQNEPSVRAPTKLTCCWINSARSSDIDRSFSVVEATWVANPSANNRDAFNYVRGFATMDDAIAYVVQAINMGIIA